LQRGPLTEPEVVRLGSQVASALTAAHAQGVIHRDLKPGNIMVNARGDATVLDFGIAKQIPGIGAGTTTDLTDTFGIVGTAPYMAPEQIIGRPVDARTDLFALGTVLYEMGTGRRPFHGVAAGALIHAILNESPPAPRTVNPSLSPSLEGVILKCLEKDPDRRFASAAKLEGALTTGAPRATLAWLRPRWAAGIALAVLAMAVVLALGRLPRNWFGPRTPTVAVLPFENLSNDPDQQFFADGMTDELIVTLSRVRGLKVIARTSSMAFADSKQPLRDIAGSLRASSIVIGSVQTSGNRIRLRAQLVDARSERTMWGNSYERDLGDVFALQSDLAGQVVEQVRGNLGPADRDRLRPPRRVDPQAHEHYLRGRYYWHRFGTENWRRALDEFQHAIDRDPTFALAYAGLADTYCSMNSLILPVSEAMPQARAAAARALELSPDLAPALGAMGYVQFSFDYDLGGAESSFRRALEISPNEVTVLQYYGTLLHTIGRFDEAIEVLGRARELDPLSRYVAAMTLWPLNQGRRHEQAISEARRQLAADSSAYATRLILAQALAFTGRNAEAVSELERLVHTEDYPTVRGWLGWAYARAGRRAEAQATLAELVRRSESEVVQPYAIALTQVGLGLNDDALVSLGKSVDEHWDETMFIKVDPAWDPVRSDPRFQALLRRRGYE
jgi:serine/threonine-protein kinase